LRATYILIIFITKEKTMRLPWKATPVLTGKDAARFIKRMHEAETRPITKKEKLECKLPRAQGPWL